MLRKMFKKIGSLVVCCAIIGAQVATPVQAAIVGTAQLLTGEQRDQARERLLERLMRSDVQQHLVAYGVTPDAAKERVAKMTDSEVAQLNSRIAELPAGGDVLGLVVFLFVFFVITDAIGITDIFTFVRPLKR